MSDNRFAVVFSGVIVPGASREQVKLNFAKLFKVEPARVEPMFSGKRVVIKAQLDQATAQKYQAALKSAGAVCEVVDTAAKPAAPQPSSAQPAARPQPQPQQAAPAKPAAPAAASARPAPATPQWQVEQPGVVLVAPKEVKPLQVDLSGLSMDEPGVVLVQHKEKVAPAINTGHLSVAEAGSDLAQRREVPDLQVDLSALSMAEPGVALVEPKKVVEPKIDTSKLSMG